MNRLGKAEGVVIFAAFVLIVLVALLGFSLLTGDQFVSAFQVYITAFLGGSALASFRDFKKGA